MTTSDLALFNLGHETLPVYVTAMPGILMGAIVGLVIFAIGSGISLHDRLQTKNEKDVQLRLRWM